MRTAPLRNQLGFYAFAFLALTGAASCGGDDDPAEEEGKPSGAVCPSGSTLTYENFGRTFMTTYCTRCHSSAVTGEMRQGAPADHNFDSLAGIVDMAEHIDEHAAAGPDSVNTAMPPSDPKPMADDRRKLGEWLACITSDGDGGTQAYANRFNGRRAAR
jgi:uncharacterized membrane protein